MVAQLCSDFDYNYPEVNKQLDKMGYNIGMRLVEDFFAKSGIQRCGNLRETAETISKVCLLAPTLFFPPFGFLLRLSNDGCCGRS